MPYRPRFASLFLGLALAVLSLTPVAQAEDTHPEAMHVHDAYARVTASSGAIYFMVHNTSAVDDRLVSTTTDAARMATLHAQAEDANGVMQMREIEGGLPLAAGEMIELVRGGDHIMLMGLAKPLRDGDTITLTLRFAQAGDIVVKVAVDNARKPGQAGHDHDAMQHDDAAPDTEAADKY